MTHIEIKTRWRVGLSNGENCTEGSYPFEFKMGGKSPWLRLLDYLKKNDLEIRSLSLIYKDQTFNLPSKSTDPKFAAFRNAQKPIGYEFGRPVAAEQASEPELYARITALYDNYELQLWVNEKNPRNSWVIVK